MNPIKTTLSALALAAVALGAWRAVASASFAASFRSFLVSHLDSLVKFP